ncbi:MAG: hypothetical protein IPM60_16545 [Rhodospirillales bacterium]|nr:hypothetical protein [Rhodospirillales bacterium]
MAQARFGLAVELVQGELEERQGLGPDGIADQDLVQAQAVPALEGEASGPRRLAHDGIERLGAGGGERQAGAVVDQALQRGLGQGGGSGIGAKRGHDEDPAGAGEGCQGGGEAAAGVGGDLLGEELLELVDEQGEAQLRGRVAILRLPQGGGGAVEGAQDGLDAAAGSEVGSEVGLVAVVALGELRQGRLLVE